MTEDKITRKPPRKRVKPSASPPADAVLSPPADAVVNQPDPAPIGETAKPLGMNFATRIVAILTWPWPRKR